MANHQLFQISVYLSNLENQEMIQHFIKIQHQSVSASFRIISHLKYLMSGYI